MIGNQELRIRERAHVIWEREGRPEGRAATHWQMATAEIASEGATPAGKRPRAKAARAAGEATTGRAAAAPKAAKTATKPVAATAARSKRSRKAAD